MVPLHLGGGGKGGLRSYIQGLYRFLNKKFKYFTFPIFKDSISAKKRMESMYLLGFPQRE